ncbi:MAG TPA: MFS transporter [Alphaproteobacteria bacterium]
MDIALRYPFWFGKNGLLSLIVIVSALGYFVDVYDLVLFSTVRIASLTDLNVAKDDIFSTGVFLLNCQMAGMLLGGLLWGIIGDKYGRLTILFGSILMYSLANLANAVASSVDQYAILRFIAGVGLAGELGGAVTLVSEVMDKSKRGYGTAIIAAIGMMGAVAAALVAKMVDWRAAYFIGGILGLFLLILRLKVVESGMFAEVRERESVKRGNLTMLIWPPKRLLRYVAGILIGVPTYFTIVIFMTFAPELTAALNATAPIAASDAVILLYVGLCFGGIGSGLITQKLRSRKKCLGLFITGMMLLSTVYLNSPDGMSWLWFASLTIGLGFFTGYFCVFVMLAAEQFGTNIRALTATSTSNFVRAASIPVAASYAFFKDADMPYENGAMIIGAACFAVGFIGLIFVHETFERDLDYIDD